MFSQGRAGSPLAAANKVSRLHVRLPFGGAHGVARPIKHNNICKNNAPGADLLHEVVRGMKGDFVSLPYSAGFTQKKIGQKTTS